jgi:hypothetical protein
MFKKNFVDINPLLDKEKYIIFTDLRKDGRSIIEDTDKKEWWNGLARELGQQTKNIVIDGKRAVEPPISSHEHRFGVVVIGKGIIVKEQEIGKIKRFIFDKF